MVAECRGIRVGGGSWVAGCRGVRVGGGGWVAEYYIVHLLWWSQWGVNWRTEWGRQLCISNIISSVVLW